VPAAGPRVPAAGFRYDVLVRRFPLTASRGLEIASWAVAVVAVAAAVAALALPVGAGLPPVARWALALPLLLVLATWALAPRAVAIGGGELRVERNAWPSVVLPLGRVRQVGELPPTAVSSAVQTIGNAGVFGYFGRYRSAALGPFRLYARRRDGMVAVRTDEELLVVAPERPEAFVDALLSLAPRAERAVSAGPRSAGRGLAAGFRWLVVLAAIVVAGAFVASSWARAPKAVRVSGGAVLVERKLWWPVRIPLARVRDVRELPEGALRGARRVAGDHTLGVLYGTWESPSLGRFELYAPRRDGLVLLETDTDRVVVAPDELEDFVAEVREHIGRPRGAGGGGGG
jgi:hypothetical protein